jgi:hypothetical protein
MINLKKLPFVPSLLRGWAFQDINRSVFSAVDQKTQHTPSVVGHKTRQRRAWENTGED